jgi:hypothetical protein
MTSLARKAIYAVLAVLVLTAFAYFFFRPSGDRPPALPAAIGGRSSNAGPDPIGQGRPSGVNAQGQPVGAERKLPPAFYTAKSCYLTFSRIKMMQSASNCERLAAKVGLEGAYAECLKSWDDTHPFIDSAQRSFANLSCGDEHDLFAKYYNSTKESAKSGNSDAQLCYLQSDFLDLDNKPPYTQADIAEYQAASPKYIEDAFSRGDWRVVQLMSSDHHGAITGLSLYIPNIGTPDTMYKMTRLLRLGASGEYAEQLDAKLDTIARPDGKENPELPQARVADADAWAQKTFSQYFAGAPRLSEPPSTCRIDTPATDAK